MKQAGPGRGSSRSSAPTTLIAACPTTYAQADAVSVNVALTGCDPVVMIPEDAVGGATTRSVLAFRGLVDQRRPGCHPAAPEQGTRLRATGEGGFSFGLGARIATTSLCRLVDAAAV